MACFFALFVPFAYISTGLCLWLRVGAAFSSLQAAPRAPCLRVQSPFSFARSFMGLRWPVLRWVRSMPMTFVGSLPRWLFTVTGQSPRCLMRPPGAPVRCLPPFTCVTFGMSFRVFARWVRSWLRVRGSCSPYLFPICSGGGGGSMSPLSPLLRGSVACFGYWLWWPALPVPVRVLGYPVFVFFYTFLLFLLFMCILFICIMRVPA